MSKDASPSGYVISSVRVEVCRTHDVVTLWNRGAHAGELVLKTGDGAKLAALIEAVNAYAEAARCEEDAEQAYTFDKAQDALCDAAIAMVGDGR